MSNLFNFEGHFQYPGMGVPTEEAQAPSHFKSVPANPLVFKQARIDGSARDAGNTGYTDVLRPGLLLGEVYTTGNLKQWNPDATDGTHRIAGILGQSLHVTASGANQNKFINIAVGGAINERGLCIASSAVYGIDGSDEEYNIRAQMVPSFQFIDDALGRLAGNYAGIMIVAATATLTEAHNGSHIMVRGATGAVTLTLPATPKRGLRFRVTNVSDQNLIVAAGTADTMVTLNDLAADSVALSTSSEKIGGTFEFIGDGTGWVCIPMRWEAQTITIVTA